MYAGEWKDEPLHSRGHEDTMQSKLCPAARFSSYKLQCSPVWLKSKVSYSTKTRRAACENPIGKRQANVALLGCSEIGLGSSRGKIGSSSNSGYCNPQPCRSSKTIAGLMHTPMTSETLHRPTALFEPEAPGASGEQPIQRGIPLSHMHKTKSHIYIHLPDKIFIL